METITLKAIMARLKVPSGTIRLVSDDTAITCSCPLAKWKHVSGEDRHPSFWAVSGPVPRYTCFSCHSKGTIKDLLQEYYRLSGDYVSYDHYAGRYDHLIISDEKEWTKIEMQLPEELLDPLQDFRDYPEAEEFLRDKRRLSLDYCDKYGILFDPDRGMVVFPCRGTHGRLVGAVGRSIEGKRFHNYFHAKMGGSLGGVDKVPEDPKAIVIVEGWMDLVSAAPWVEKWDAAVVCTWKSTLSAGQAAILSSWICPLVCGYDSDDAGEKGWGSIKSYYETMSGSRVRRLIFPKGRDVNDLSEDDFDRAYRSSLSV